MNELREAFEKLFPVPDGVERAGDKYVEAKPNASTLIAIAADTMSERWIGFQAGAAHALEEAAKVCDEQEKTLYATLKGNSDAIPSSVGAGICAEAIRAMKSKGNL